MRSGYATLNEKIEIYKKKENLGICLETVNGKHKHFGDARGGAVN